MDSKGLLHRSLFLMCAITLIAFGSFSFGFAPNQVIAIVAFFLSILGTVLFWQFRLSFAFFGGALILVSGVTTLENFIRLSSMDVIFFLIGMMIIVGFLREIGLFNYLLQRTIIVKGLTARKMTVGLIFSSALMACVVDEVSSIVFMMMVIFEFCDYFEFDPVPFIIVSVMATNIGSTGTVIGNPIGLLIATKANLTFEHFLVFAFPLMFLTLFILCALVFLIFKKQLNELDEKIQAFGSNDFLVSLLRVPPEKNIRIGFIIFIITILLISFHHRIEVMLGLGVNTFLLMVPLMSSAFIMVWRRDRARHYVEHDVEWWSILFFIFLFAEAGVISELGIAETVANSIFTIFEGSKAALIAPIVFITAIISSALDNVVVVAGFIPVIQHLTEMLNVKHVLWWAFLFGACFGGNITIIGSTANIIAIGAMEKRLKRAIGFREWLKIGVVVGIVTLLFVTIVLIFVPYYK
ncbi:MAG: SLC13 family permease [Candidatus Omnitrophica bacterium]|nr:SLC13 family permease [Candidatus Omnitrophota bacterium]